MCNFYVVIVFIAVKMFVIFGVFKCKKDFEWLFYLSISFKKIDYYAI